MDQILDHIELVYPVVLVVVEVVVALVFQDAELLEEQEIHLQQLQLKELMVEKEVGFHLIKILQAVVEQEQLEEILYLLVHQVQVEQV